jgi:hypothetical protein
MLLHLIQLGFNSSQKALGGSQASCKAGTKEGLLLVTHAKGLLGHELG